MDVGDLDFDDFEKALRTLVKAGWASKEFREGERGPIGGWARREGDYYTPKRGAEKAAGVAFGLWKASKVFDLEVEARLYRLAGAPRPRKEVAPAPEPQRDEKLERLEALVAAGDAAGLVEAVRALDVSMRAHDSSDLWRFTNCLRARLTEAGERGRDLQGAIVHGCDGLPAAMCAADLPNAEAERLLGVRAVALFKALVADLGALGEDDAGVIYMHDVMGALLALAEMQPDPESAFGELRTIFEGWSGSGMDDALLGAGSFMVVDWLGSIETARGAHLQAGLGPKGTIERLEAGDTFSPDQEKLVKDVLSLNDQPLSLRLARLSPTLVPGYLRELLPELVRRGWHSAVDEAVEAHEDALYWLIEELLDAGYVPGAKATDALRRRAGTWPHSPVHKETMLRAAAEGATRRGDSKVAGEILSELRRTRRS